MVCPCSNNNSTNDGTLNSKVEATHNLYYKDMPIALVTIVKKEKFHGREVNHEANSICRIVKILDSCPNDIPLIVDYPKGKYKYMHELLPNLLIVWKTSDIRQIA